MIETAIISQDLVGRVERILSVVDPLDLTYVGVPSSPYAIEAAQLAPLLDIAVNQGSIEDLIHCTLFPGVAIDAKARYTGLAQVLQPRVQ
jgi:hypothetical protein